MSFGQEFEFVVRNFTANFNQMCRGSGRDYLIRSPDAKAESKGKEKTYPVEYKMEDLGYGWSVYAEWRKWYIFSKKFPFMQIEETGSNQIKLAGLFTENMPMINRNPAELRQLLQKYLEHCRSLPVQSFVSV